MTRLTGRALRVTIFIGETDLWHHRPVYTEIVHRARKAGLAGASVFRGSRGSAHRRWSTRSGSCR